MALYFVLGVLVALFVVAAVAGLRRTPTIGQGELQPPGGPEGGVHLELQAESQPPDARAQPGRPTVTVKLTKRVVFKHGEPMTTTGTEPHGLVDALVDAVAGDNARAAMTSGPTTTETIVVDGQTYHSLDEIPDPARREAVRRSLERAAAEITDPAIAAVLHEELESLEGGQASLPAGEPPSDPPIDPPATPPRA